MAAELKEAGVVNLRWKLRATTSIAPEIRVVSVRRSYQFVPDAKKTYLCLGDHLQIMIAHTNQTFQNL